MDTLNSKQSVDLALTDQAKAEIDQQLGYTARQAGLTVQGNDILMNEQVTPDMLRQPLDENAVDGRDIEEGKGWFREGRHGRAVDVQDIRVERIEPPKPEQPTSNQEQPKEQGKDKTAESEVKYRMTAVINGQTISHDITEKQYNKFMALDDEHRMKLFAKVFPRWTSRMCPRRKTLTALPLVKSSSQDSPQPWVSPTMSGISTTMCMAHVPTSISTIPNITYFLKESISSQVSIPRWMWPPEPTRRKSMPRSVIWKCIMVCNPKPPVYEK